MDLCNPKEVRQLMDTFGLAFNKNLGQNFLINHFVVEDIADNCCGDEASTILEIGPGIGSLTKELAERYQNVVALEIDKGLITVLKFTLGSYPNVTVINQDVMKADLTAILEPYFKQGPVSVCANLPYYITTPIMMNLLESGLPFDYITVMIQAEVADRLCSAVGGKDCGAITTILNYYGTAERLFEVDKNNYLPAPKVDSTVIRIKLHKEKPFVPKNEKIFFKTVKAAFEQRRKTLPNALNAGFPELTKEQCVCAVQQVNLDVNIRGEKLSLKDFIDLSDVIAGML